MLSKKNFQKTTVKFFLPEYKTVFIGKGMIFLILLLLIAFSNGPILKAQNPEWKVYNTSNSGLPNDGVSCLTIDGSGNIWIGTYDWDTDNGGGLVKYDGVNWTVYDTSNSSLPDIFVRCLVIDESGNKWIGTGDTYERWFFGRELVKYDGANWTVYDTSNSSLPDNDVYCLAVDNNGDIWIGTDGGLAKYNGTNWTVYYNSNSGLPYNYITSLAIDRSGNKWIGTGGKSLSFPIFSPYEKGKGLAKYDGINWTVYDTSNSGLPDNGVNCLAIDLTGNIWVGTWDEGLAKYDGTNWTIYNTSNSGLPNNVVKCLNIDGSENIWIGTRGGGLAKYDGENWTVYNTSNSGLPSNWVDYLAIDENGNKWIGTNGGGLAVFNEGGIVSVKKLEKKDGHYPDKFILSQNYPNPFNPSTTIKYSLPKQSYVTLKVYDILGREIEILVTEEKPAGVYEINWNASKLSSGVYFYQLKAGDYVSTKKMILLR
jgi:ligand-binding sensor domain-containing protein